MGNLGATQKRSKTFFCMSGPEVACKELRGWSGWGSLCTQKVKWAWIKPSKNKWIWAMITKR